MNTSVSDRFINDLYEIAQTDLPESVIKQAKICLLDYVGVTIAGSKILNKKGNNIIEFINNNSQEATVIGFNRKTNFYQAALVNGMSAHIAELDDGVRQGSIHPGAPIISALLVIAEIKNISGNNLLKGIIVGYEAAIRLANAIQPSHRNKGYHATGTCGTIGVAMGIAASLDFSKTQYKTALSAAVSSSSGMLNITKGKSELKPYNAGQAAVSGLIAANIAQAGFVGSEEVFDGDWGYFKMISDNWNHSFLHNQTGKFAIENVYLKPYAACRHCHPAIEAALILKNKYKIDVELIKEVNIHTYNLATSGHDHSLIEGITSAKLSTPYSVAVALTTGFAGLNEFSEIQLNNSNILDLTKRIKVYSVKDLEILVPNKRPAIVEIITTTNQIYKHRVDLAKGEPENPLSIDEIKNKYISLLKFAGKTDKEIDTLSKIIWKIETKLEQLIIELRNT